MVIKVTPWLRLEARHECADLVKGFIPAPAALVLIIGASGSGKTFFAGEAARCVGAGRPFLGRRTRRVAVAYLGAENPASVERRFAAWRDEAFVAHDDDVLLNLVSGSINLTHLGATNELLEALRAADPEPLWPQLLFIDTLAAASPGADENAGQDMGEILASCAALRDELQSTVVLIHHHGKDAARGARGHSSLHAAADVVIEVTADAAGVRTARVVKSRDGAIGDELHFGLRVIDLGTDEDGDAITTCAVEPAAPASPMPELQRLGAQARIALDALRELVADTDDRTPQTTTMPGGKPCATVEAWRERFRARRGRLPGLTGEDRQRELDAARKAFDRGTSDLIARRVVGIWETRAWIW